MTYTESELNTNEVNTLGLNNQKNHNGVEHDNNDLVLPVRNRKVRDVLFLLIFLIFLASLSGLVGYTATKGNLDRLTHGVDKYGNICGKINALIPDAPRSGQDLRHRPYAEASDIDGTTVYYNCTDQCSPESTSLFYRCIPKRVARIASSVGEIVSQVTSTDFLQESAEDIEACWKEIVYLCLIALALSIAITVLLRFIAGIIIWISIGLAVVASVAGTGYLWYCWYKAKKAVADLDPANSSMYTSSVHKWLGYAVVATIGTALLLLMVLVMRNRIRLVVALFAEAGKSITAMPCLLLQPVLTFLGLIFICTSWIYGMLWIESAGDPRVYGDGKVSFEKNHLMLFVRWYHVFALIWVSQFCLACQDYVIGGAVSEWYFTRDKRELKKPILTSIERLLCYHVGSIALGSLIIAIIKAIRMLLKLLQKRLSQHSSASCAQCIMCAIQCILYCFENFLKYLSRNAYIEIGIFGISFCAAAKRAFQIITNNALRVAAINSVGDFTLMLSKLGVILAVIFIGIEMVKVKAEVHHIWVPILLCALFALFISHCFLSVYEMSIDTLLVCFCEDCDMNDGFTKPYYMNTSLMQFVNDTKKELARLTASKNKIQPSTATQQQATGEALPQVM